MANVTRRRAIYQVQNVLQAYKNKIEYASTYFNNLTNEGQEIVIDYNKKESETKRLLTNAIKESSFFYGMDNTDLIQYAKICKKLNSMFNLNVNDVENITKIVNDDFYITSDAQRITSFTEVELGRDVTYNIGNTISFDANNKLNQFIYDVEWEVEDLNGNLDEATAKREKRLFKLVNFAKNTATDCPIISLFSKTNPLEIKLKATQLGEYKIRAKIYNDYEITKDLIDVIEFHQLVSDIDEKIASLSTIEKLKKALSMVQWKQEIDIELLVEYLLDAIPMICFMSVLIATFGEIAAAILSLMQLSDGGKDLFEGFVKTAEGFLIVKNAGSNNALKHGGEVIHEGLFIFGLGAIEVFLSKCSMEGVQNARRQLLRGGGTKALRTSGSAGLPSIVSKGANLPATSATSVVKEISKIQLSKALSESAKKTSDFIADVYVQKKSEKVLLEEMITNVSTIETFVSEITDNKIIQEVVKNNPSTFETCKQLQSQNQIELLKQLKTVTDAELALNYVKDYPRATALMIESANVTNPGKVPETLKAIKEAEESAVSKYKTIASIWNKLQTINYNEYDKATAIINELLDARNEIEQNELCAISKLIAEGNSNVSTEVFIRAQANNDRTTLYRDSFFVYVSNPMLLAGRRNGKEEEIKKTLGKFRNLVGIQGENVPDEIFVDFIVCNNSNIASSYAQKIDTKKISDTLTDYFKDYVEKINNGEKQKDDIKEMENKFLSCNTKIFEQKGSCYVFNETEMKRFSDKYVESLNYRRPYGTKEKVIEFLIDSKQIQGSELIAYLSAYELIDWGAAANQMFSAATFTITPDGKIGAVEYGIDQSKMGGTFDIIKINEENKDVKIFRTKINTKTGKAECIKVE